MNVKLLTFLKINILAGFLGLILIAANAFAAEKQPVDLSGFWMLNYQRQPTGAGAELYNKIPKDAVFIDDGGGGELGEGDYAGLQLSEKAKHEIASHDFDAEFNIENTCVQPSVAYYMQAPFPIEIHQAEELIVVKMEYFDMVRLIFMDGRTMPDNAPHNKNGYSVGHWEGDELVVRTEKIKSYTLMNNGFNHSDNLIMDERFKVSKDGKTLSLIQTYQDSEVYKGIAARYVSWSKKEGEFVYPYECDYSFAE